MNILEEFWYGNIEPAEYDISSSKEYKELLQLISRNEEKLLATMAEADYGVPEELKAECRKRIPELAGSIFNKIQQKTKSRRRHLRRLTVV